MKTENYKEHYTSKEHEERLREFNKLRDASNGVFVQSQKKLEKDSWNILITRVKGGKIVEKKEATNVSKQIIHDLIEQGVFN
jgi:hypothetical protein